MSILLFQRPNMWWVGDQQPVVGKKSVSVKLSSNPCKNGKVNVKMIMKMTMIIYILI